MFSWLLSDYVKVSNIATDQMLYTEKDIEASMDRIETVNFHQETEVGGIKFWCYNAGHVLGAAMFMIEIAGVKVWKLLYIYCIAILPVMCCNCVCTFYFFTLYVCRCIYVPYGAKNHTLFIFSVTLSNQIKSNHIYLFQ